MAVQKNLDWLTTSTVKDKDSFIGSWHLYTDLRLDLKQATKQTVNKNEIIGSITNRQRDLEAVYDTECITHSLYELFRTKRGDRVLVPEYGTRLYEYIGEHITDLNCESIKDMLELAIKTWEPRVTVTNITVKPKEDDSEVDIHLYVNIPEIQASAAYDYLFDSSTGKLTFLETSR